jgi:hypothetical protein
MRIKSYATPIILAAIVFGLGAIAYWDETKTAKEKIAEEAKGKLFDFNPASVVAIEVKSATAEPKAWKLSKDTAQNKWSVSSPITYKADAEIIDRLLKTIASAKSERAFERGDRALASFGLEPSQISYILKDAAGKSWTFEIGGKSPTGYSSYARVSSDQSLHLVNQYLFTATNKTLSDFRDKSLAIPPIAEINKVDVIFSGDKLVSLSRSGKDWTMTAPYQAKGDTIDINKWLSSWDSLRVSEFIDSPGTELRNALSVTGKGSKELVKIAMKTEKLSKELKIVENNAKVYAQLTEDTFAELDKPSIESLRKSPSEFEDRSVFRFVSADVTEVSIDGTHYVREKGEWRTGGKPKPFIQGMLTSLEFVKADARLSEKESTPYIKGPALISVEIKGANQAPVQFSVWKKSGDDQKLILKAGEAHFEVKSEFLDILRPKTDEQPPTLGGGEPKGEKS